MTWELEITKVIVSSVFGYFVGNRTAKVKDKRNRIKERLTEARLLTRNTADEAIKYFTAEMDARERSASCALIVTNMKRISTDLRRLTVCCGKSDRYFSKVQSGFYNAVTSDPFGADTIDILRHDHIRVRKIQDAEKLLVEKLSELEDN
jgi:hypothetical protein